MNLSDAVKAVFGSTAPIAINLDEQTPPAQPPAGQAAAAPGGGQGDGSGVKPTPDAAAPAQGQAAKQPELKDADILARLGVGETPEQELARLRRDSGASRQEALRLKKIHDGVQSILDSQGLSLVLNEQGEVIGTAPTEKYSQGAPLKIDFKALPEEQQALAETKPQALIDMILDQAKKALVRAAPTMDRKPPTLSPERENAAVQYLSALVEADGQTKVHENIANNMPLIRQFIAAPDKTAIRQMVAEDPTTGFAILNAWVESAKASLVRVAQREMEARNAKNKGAQQSFVPGPQGGGSPAIPSGDGSQNLADLGRTMAKAIASARSF